MNQRFYIDITLLDQKNLGLKLMTQVMSNLHRLLKHHAVTDVCIGFPQYGSLNAYGSPSLGEVVRLVSENKDHLSLIKGNVTFKTLASVGVLVFTNPTAVPDDASEVRFYKDSKPSKKMKALKEVGEIVGKPSYSNIERSSVLVLIERQDGTKYPIFVGKTQASQRMDGIYNSYGLTKQDGATFPSF